MHICTHVRTHVHTCICAHTHQFCWVTSVFSLGQVCVLPSGGGQGTKLWWNCEWGSAPPCVTLAKATLWVPLFPAQNEGGLAGTL